MSTREDKFLKALGNIDEKLTEDIVERSDTSEGNTVQGFGHISAGPVKEKPPKSLKFKAAVGSGIAAALVIAVGAVLAVRYSDVQAGNGLEITLAPEVVSYAMEKINRPDETVVDVTTAPASAPTVNETFSEGRAGMVDPDILITPGFPETAADTTRGAETSMAETDDDTTISVNAGTESADELYQPTDDELKEFIGMYDDASAYGITLEVTDLTKSGLTINYDRNYSSEWAQFWYLSFVSHFEIQVYNSLTGDFETYDKEHLDNWIFSDGLYEIGSGDEDFYTEKMKFYGASEYSNDLPCGLYRIKKGMSAYSKSTGEFLGVVTGYAVFEITDELPDRWGIVMNVEPVSKSTATLRIFRNESENKAKMTYGSKYDIERMNADGEWVRLVPTNSSWTLDETVLRVGDAAEEKLDLGSRYGSLSAGKYRAVKTFRDEWTGIELPVYAEFEITEYTDYGVLVYVKDVTDETLTVVIEQNGNKTNGTLAYYPEYHIERHYSNGKVEAVEMNPTTWAPEPIPIKIGGTTEYVVKYRQNCGELEDGYYSISLNLADILNSSYTYSKKTFMAFFNVGDTDNWGISLTAQDVTPEGMTLAITQRGGGIHDLRFGVDFSLDRKNSKGEWEPVEQLPAGDSTDSIYTDVIPESTQTVKIDWAKSYGINYGSLPAGKYRLAKVFQDCPVNTTFAEQTYYAEFTIAGDDPELGITLTAKDITPEGITVVTAQYGGSYTDRITYGSYFWVEKQTNGKWEALPYIHDNIGFTDLGYELNRDSTREEKINWNYMYGALSAGTYRYAKEFYGGEKKTLYAEFTLDAETASTLGVTMWVKENNTEKMTLMISQFGGSTDEQIWYDPAFVIERKSGDKWEEMPTLTGQPPTWNALAHILNRNTDTEVKVTWGEFIYGTLPEGDYRIAKTFSGGSRSETVYANFKVTASMLNKWGIGMKLHYYGTDNVQVEITQLGGIGGRSITYDLYAGVLQKQTSDGKWEIISPIGGLSDKQKILDNIATGIMFRFAEQYGIQPAGHYRYGITFNSEKDGVTEKMTIYSEFDIK